VKASDELTARLKNGLSTGITVTSPGFYGPQGRSIRIPVAHPDLNEKLTAFRYGQLRVTNYEMETAAIFGLGKMMGHHVASVCLVLANRVTGKFLADYHGKMKALAELVLDRITT
jgi:uridine phosphorylase